MDAELLYRQLGQLIATTPSFENYGPLTADQLAWIGRASALVRASNDIKLQAEFEVQSNLLKTPMRADGFQGVMLCLYKVLGVAELAAPPLVQGAFIPARNGFDAFASIAKVLGTATSDVLIVDPYLDETVLTEYAGAISDPVTIRLLADRASVRPTLEPAARRWGQQFTGRALSVRLTPARELHDRAIFVDNQTAWTLSQSIKDFAKRSPAEIIRADDVASLKIPAYATIWQNATVVI